MTRRLLLSYLSITVVVLLGLEIPFGVIYARGELSRFTSTVRSEVVVLTELTEEAIEEGELAELPVMAGDFARRTRGHVVVVDERGGVLTDTNGGAGRRTLTGDDIAAALANRPTVRTGNGLSITMPASSGEVVRGALRVTVPLAPVTDRVRHIWLVLAIAGLAVLAVATLIGLAITRWITRPLRTLERATTQLADGTITDPPATHLGPPEVRRLAAVFTRTATRLQHLLHAQRSFAADASHQLKTPLTALRLRLENLEPDLHPRSHPSLDTALTEIDRLNHMVHGLLALARLDDDATTPAPTDLDAILADRAATWAALAAEHHVTITVTGAPTGPVQAVPGAVEQILDNLLANALRVAPPHSTITLARHRTAGHVEVHVIDQGPGMSEEQRQRAFDRFWRAPGSSPDGTGLGLTIVARLVNASGGTITLHPAPGTGLDAVIRLHSATTSVAPPRGRQLRRRATPPSAHAVTAHR